MNMKIDEYRKALYNKNLQIRKNFTKLQFLKGPGTVCQISSTKRALNPCYSKLYVHDNLVECSPFEQRMNFKFFKMRVFKEFEKQYLREFLEEQPKHEDSVLNLKFANRKVNSRILENYVSFHKTGISARLNCTFTDPVEQIKGNIQFLFNHFINLFKEYLIALFHRLLFLQEWLKKINFHVF